MSPSLDSPTIDVRTPPAYGRFDVPRIVVLASGNGSNLQALLDTGGRTHDAAIVLVVSDQPHARALDRADRFGVPNVLCRRASDEDRRTYDARLADVVAAAQPDWVVLAGWMRILSSAFLDRFAGRVINLHPALPGEFPGLHAIERAWADAQAGRRDYTGLMVHLVPDEGVDTGPVLATVEVPILPDDTLELLTDRVHAAEHELLVSTVAQLVTPRLQCKETP